MRINYLFFRVFTFIVFFTSVLMFLSCSDDKKKDDLDNEFTEKDMNSNVENGGHIDRETRKIFHTLPSPIETALIIKHSGAVYDENLLNSTKNLSRYSTNKSMALNLGIYSTDLSYASMFDQTQTSILYMATAKKLAEKLGILEMIDEQTMRKLEKNINNKDVIMTIISESFMNSNASLMQNERPAVLSMVLAGGWIEGLYLATQLVDVDKADIVENDLVDRVIDQRLTITNLISLLELNKDFEDIASLLEDIKELNASFEKIKVEVSTKKPLLNTTAKIAKIKSNIQVSVTPEILKSLAKRVKKIRDKYIL